MFVVDGCNEVTGAHPPAALVRRRPRVVLLALVARGDGGPAPADETILLIGIVEVPDAPREASCCGSRVWSGAAMPPLMRSGIVGLVYVDRDTAFAWTVSEGIGLRSVDDGRSFELERNPQRPLANRRPTRVHVLPDPHGAWV